MTRNLYRMIESRQSWDSKFLLSDQDVISELNFWKQNVHSLNRKCLSEYKVPSVIVYSDASDHACGAFSCQLDNSISHKMWTDEKNVTAPLGESLKLYSHV